MTELIPAVTLLGMVVYTQKSGCHREASGWQNRAFIAGETDMCNPTAIQFAEIKEKVTDDRYD